DECAAYLRSGAARRQRNKKPRSDSGASAETVSEVCYFVMGEPHGVRLAFRVPLVVLTPAPTPRSPPCHGGSHAAFSGQLPQRLPGRLSLNPSCHQVRPSNPPFALAACRPSCREGAYRCCPTRFLASQAS